MILLVINAITLQIIPSAYDLKSYVNFHNEFYVQTKRDSE